MVSHTAIALITTERLAWRPGREGRQRAKTSPAASHSIRKAAVWRLIITLIDVKEALMFGGLLSQELSGGPLRGVFAGSRSRWLKTQLRRSLTA